MTKIQEAIQLAIEKGGYKDHIFQGGSFKFLVEDPKWIGYARIRIEGEKGASNFNSFAEIFLDPLFWQALGKALGWKEHPKYDGTRQISPAYEWYMHRFIDHLIEGKDAESYFEALLTK